MKEKLIAWAGLNVMICNDVIKWWNEDVSYPFAIIAHWRISLSTFYHFNAVWEVESTEWFHQSTTHTHTHTLFNWATNANTGGYGNMQQTNKLKCELNLPWRCGTGILAVKDRNICDLYYQSNKRKINHKKRVWDFPVLFWNVEKLPRRYLFRSAALQQRDDTFAAFVLIKH